MIIGNAIMPAGPGAHETGIRGGLPPRIAGLAEAFDSDDPAHARAHGAAVSPAGRMAPA